MSSVKRVTCHSCSGWTQIKAVVTDDPEQCLEIFFTNASKYRGRLKAIAENLPEGECSTLKSGCIGQDGAVYDNVMGEEARAL